MGILEENLKKYKKNGVNKVCLEDLKILKNDSQKENLVKKSDGEKLSIDSQEMDYRTRELIVAQE